LFLVTDPVGIAAGIGITAVGLATGHIRRVRNAMYRLGRVKPKQWIEGVSRVVATDGA
jgi:hypothetical protein